MKWFSWLFSLGCRHEWIRAVEGRRVYARCLHCLRETKGWEP